MTTENNSDIVHLIRDGNWDEAITSFFFNPNISVDRKKSVVFEMGDIPMGNGGSTKKGTVLHYALTRGTTALQDIQQLIAIGGKGLVMSRNSDESTPLHSMFTNNNNIVEMDVLRALVEAGGNDILLANNRFDNTVLHCAFCSKTRNFSTEIIQSIIHSGGHDLIMSKNAFGYTCLHYACMNGNLPIELLHSLIHQGGRALVFATNNFGCTALHSSFSCNRNDSSSIELIRALIDVGGETLVKARARNGDTVLHSALSKRFRTVISLDIIRLLLDFGGEELVSAMNSKSAIPLHSWLLGMEHIVETGEDETSTTETVDEVLMLLMEQGIKYNVCGQYSIGGLFIARTNCADGYMTLRHHHKLQSIIHKHWNTTIVPVVEKVMEHHPNQPILHCAIYAKAPAQIIRDIINRFDCIMSVDSFGQHPIRIAIQEELQWDDGMDEIIQALVKRKGGEALYIGAKNGLQWDNGMKQIVDHVALSGVLNHQEEKTKLFSFMLAASALNYDLTSIYELMRCTPQNVQLKSNF